MTIGIACGSFNFIIALVGTVLILLVLTLFKKVESKISRDSPTITIVASADEPILGRIIKVSKTFDCTIHGISTSPVEGAEDNVEVTFQAIFNSGEERLNEYLSELEKRDQSQEHPSPQPSIIDTCPPYSSKTDMGFYFEIRPIFLNQTGDKLSSIL